LSARLSAEQVLTPVDLARRLGVHPQTVHNWRLTGRGPDFFKLGKYVFYRVTDVEEFEQRQAARDGS
jgi:transposase-like protein